MLRIDGSNFNPCPYPRLQYCTPSFSGMNSRTLKLKLPQQLYERPAQFLDDSLEQLRKYRALELSTGEKYIKLASGVDGNIAVFIKSDGKFRNIGITERDGLYHSKIMEVINLSLQDKMLNIRA